MLIKSSKLINELKVKIRKEKSPFFDAKALETTNEKLNKEISDLRKLIENFTEGKMNF